MIRTIVEFVKDESKKVGIMERAIEFKRNKIESILNALNEEELAAYRGTKTPKRVTKPVIEKEEEDELPETEFMEEGGFEAGTYEEVEE